MTKTLERFIGFLKNDPSYKLDDSYSFKQTFFILWYRFRQCLRGSLLKLKISSKGITFCGRNVIVEHGYQISAGRSLIVEDGVHINALSEKGVTFGNNVTIAKRAILSCTGVIAYKGQGIRIGNNSAVGADSYLGGQGGITIGDDVIMGPHVKIFSENHNYSKLEIPIRKQGERREGVIIESNCWIGAGSIILDGVHIASGCVIAAGSVVTKSISPNSVVAGIPAKLVKTRNSNLNLF